MTNQPACCPQCQKPLASDAPLGICPSCLLGAAAQAPVSPFSPPRVESISGLERFLSPTTPSQYRFVPPSAQDLAPFFPALEILELIGFGGMGAVYKARQIKLDRLVALKIIRPEAQADPTFAERFNREARTLARLSHPGIVAIHDFGEVSGEITGAAPLYYFVMEFVDGTNLRQLLRNPMDPAQALTVIPQVCDALQYAHQEGVVHRDIKPENILIDVRGRVKIADFGLARMVVGSAEEWTLTGTHQVMGTPRYMAPEQMEGSHSVDHRADIYSLGVVFYEMLTGQIPAGHFEPPSRKAKVHPGLDGIVLRAMAREPERRFQSISELRVQVEKFASAPAAFRAVPYGYRDDQTGIAGQSDDSYANASGMSAIMSREAMAAMRFVVGPSTEKTSSRAPRLLMLLLALVPFVMLFFPWFDIYVTDPEATLGMPEHLQEVYNNVPARHLVLMPIQMASGITFIVFMVFVVALQAVSLGQQRTMVRIALPGLLFLGLAILFLLIHRSELSYQFVPVYADPVTGAMPHNHMSFSNGEGRSFLGPLTHDVVYRPAFFATFACCVVLLVFSASEVRHAFVALLRRRAERRAMEGPESVETRAGRYLLILSVLIFISGGITFTIIVDDGDLRDEALYFVATLQVACLPVTIFALLAGFTLKQQHVTQIVRIALILLLLPLTPASVISIPVAAWCLAALRNRTQQVTSPQQPGRDVPAAAVVIHDTKKRLGSALNKTGVLLMFTAALFFLLSFMASTVQTIGPGEMTVAPAKGPLMIVLASLLATVSLSIWSLMAATSLRRGATNQMARRVAFAYLLPMTPAWPITFFVGLYCRQLLDDLQNESPDPSGHSGQAEEEQAAGLARDAAHDRTGAEVPTIERVSKLDDRYWQRRGLQAAFVVALLMFLTIRTDFSTGLFEDGMQVTSRSQVTRVGLPEPWFVSETVYDASGQSTRHQFRWLGHSLWIMVAGLVCYFVADRMAPANGTRRKRWILSPAAMTSMTLVLAIWMAFLSTWSSTSGGVRNALFGDPRPELLQAVQNSNQPAVQRLLENGNSANPPLPEGFNSPLWWAVAENDSMITAMLLVYQADVNFSSKEGITPLMLAACKGDVATCGSLINLGANINAQDFVSSSEQHTIFTTSSAIYWPGARMTPLMLAAWNGHEPVAKLLLERGADPMQRDASGRTAYEIANARNFMSIHNLILGSIQPAVEIPAGETTSFAPAMPEEALALMLAKALMDDDLDSVKAWKLNGGSLLRANSSGQTALMQAAAAGRERIVAWLMLAGSDPLQRDPNGQTPLMIAAAAGHALTVEMILKLEQIGFDEEIQFRMSQMASDLPGGLDFQRYHFDAGIDQADSSGETAWMKAAAGGHLQAFEILTEMTLAEKLTPDGKSWLSMAVENKQESLLCSLLDKAIAQMEYIQKGFVSSSRITPGLMCLKDAANRNPLERARELGLLKVAEKMETYCQLLIKSMDQHLQEVPDDPYAAEVKAKCQKTLGQN